MIYLLFYESIGLASRVLEMEGLQDSLPALRRFWALCLAYPWFWGKLVSEDQLPHCPADLLLSI